jgi:hypothetical protein
LDCQLHLDTFRVRFGPDESSVDQLHFV